MIARHTPVSFKIISSANIKADPESEYLIK
jgi:hypothetical protein